MRIAQLLCLLACLSSSLVCAADATIAEVTHRQLQAVNANGVGIYSATDKVVFEGIVLNSPEEMLNPAPGAGFMGGQWQVYIQGEGDDHAGTAVWLGQYYSKVTSSDDYTDTELLDELFRINTDPNTGYVFTPGDRVRVTGWYKFYKGKINCNEQHDKNPFKDFTIELVKPAVGLPVAEAVTLDQLKDPGNQFMFDANRLTGPEYYQGCLVRLDNVTIVDPENWGLNKTITVTDGQGRTFPVLLGIGDGFSRYACPTGLIDVIGIMDQESTSYNVCKDGYRVWVTNYDGNGLVLTHRGYKRGNLPGDINGDFKVDIIDFAELAGNWMKCTPGLCQ